MGVNQQVGSSNPVWGAKLSDNELSALLVNGATARTCWKWPILREGPLSCSAIRPVHPAQTCSLAHSRATLSVSPPTSARLVNCQRGGFSGAVGTDQRGDIVEGDGGCGVAKAPEVLQTSALDFHAPSPRTRTGPIDW